MPEEDLVEEVRPGVHARARGCPAFAVEEVSGDGDLRLYRLDVVDAEVHARGGHPRWGLGIDTRLPVTL